MADGLLFILFMSSQCLLLCLAGWLCFSKNTAGFGVAEVSLIVPSLVMSVLLLSRARAVSVHSSGVAGSSAASWMHELPAVNARSTESIIEQLPIALLVTNADGTIRFSNRRACKMFAEAEERGLLGMHVTTLLPSLNRQVGAIEQPGTATVKTNDEAVRITHERFPVRMHLRAVDIERQQLTLIAIEDLSREKELEKLKEDFLAMVSHDMRSPLSAIKGRVAMLRLGQAVESRAGDFDTIDELLDRLIRLINELLQVEQISSGSFSLQLDTILLNDIFELALNSVKADADAKEITFIFKTKEAKDVMVRADKDRLVQVLVNLMSNAIKFSSRDSSVSVECGLIDQSVTVSVIDEGRGIPHYALESVFEKYKQMDAAGDGKSGVGLGLPICKALIQQHGGTIGIESAEGNGCRVWFTLPRISAHSVADVPQKL